jgi:hypothetical protein
MCHAQTSDQAEAQAKGDPVRLTADQLIAMMTARLKDTQKWLAFLLGRLLILIGALAVLAGAPPDARERSLTCNSIGQTAKT